MKRYWCVRRMLVGLKSIERASHLAVTNGLSDHPTHELEIVQMIGVDDTQRIRLEGRAVCRWAHTITKSTRCG